MKIKASHVRVCVRSTSLTIISAAASINSTCCEKVKQKTNKQKRKLNKQVTAIIVVYVPVYGRLIIIMRRIMMAHDGSFLADELSLIHI